MSPPTTARGKCHTAAYRTPRAACAGESRDLGSSKHDPRLAADFSSFALGGWCQAGLIEQRPRGPVGSLWSGRDLRGQAAGDGVVVNGVLGAPQSGVAEWLAKALADWRSWPARFRGLTGDYRSSCSAMIRLVGVVSGWCVVRRQPVSFNHRVTCSTL